VTGEGSGFEGARASAAIGRRDSIRRGGGEVSDSHRAYWRANLRLLCILLVVWFAASFGAGILFVERLNAIRLGGFPLGFWFSQQGSILVFVVLVFVYARTMDRLERQLGKDAEDS
jgi:putative solute:sodium symporter small subunit